MDLNELRARPEWKAVAEFAAEQQIKADNLDEKVKELEAEKAQADKTSQIHQELLKTQAVIINALHQGNKPTHDAALTRLNQLIEIGKTMIIPTREEQLLTFASNLDNQITSMKSALDDLVSVVKERFYAKRAR